MTIKLIVLTIAAAIGLSAQDPVIRLTADVPFPFDFHGKSMVAGSYEIVRATLPDTVTLRNLKTGETVRVMPLGADRSAKPHNGIVFEVTGGAYFFRSVVDAASGAAYNIGRTRKQTEAARATPAAKVYIAAR